jgi:hypothetical protein
MQVMEVAHHGHLMSLTPVRMTAQRKLGDCGNVLRTPQSLGYGHRDLLIYQAI